MAGTGDPGDAAALTGRQAAVAEAVLAAAFGVLMAVLVAVAWRTGGAGLSGLAKNLAVAVPALFGAVINPRSGTNGPPRGSGGRGLVHGRTWVALTFAGLAAVVLCGLGVLVGSHPDSAAALTAALAAFAGLFLDTGKVTHTAGGAAQGPGGAQSAAGRAGPTAASAPAPPASVPGQGPAPSGTGQS